VEEEECFDILLDYGANEALLDVEGYTPMNFHRSPHLLDMHQIRGLNQCFEVFKQNKDFNFF